MVMTAPRTLCVLGLVHSAAMLVAGVQAMRW